MIDELTLLKDIPKEAWDNKLGNRSTIEWILDQYKEKKPLDPIIAKNLTRTGLQIIRITL